MSRPDATLTIAFGPFRLLPSQRLLLESDRPVRLGNRAVEILIALVERSGEIVSKDELNARVWPNTVVEEGNLKVHVSSLRKALGDGVGGNRYIINVPRRGYQFVASVSRPDHPHSAGQSGLLRPRLSRMIGRGATVDALSAQLPRSTLLTIVGPGGVGKTSVALAVVQRLLGSYRDGTQFVDLAPIGDPLLVPSALASLLKVAVQSADPTLGLIGFLENKQMLLVLDSCEHVLSIASSFAERLLANCSEISILATSREPLRADGEYLLRLPPLEVPPPRQHPMTAFEALSFSAVQLFVERASAALSGYQLTDVDAPVVAEICRTLEGNPLAIELAAGRAGVFGVEGLGSRLDNRFQILKGGRRAALPRHQTLRATLDWSYELLSREEQAILQRLAVLAGHFTLEAAGAVAKDDSICVSEVVDGVASLVEKSLISADIDGPTASYRLLDTTRAYAHEKLVEAGEFQQLARRHAEYHLGYLQRTEADWANQDTIDWVGAYRGLIDNVRAAIDWAFAPAGDAEIGIALTIAALPLWLNMSLIDECRRRVGVALESCDDCANQSPRQRMQLLTALGVALYSIGPGPEAKAAWLEALEIAESLDDWDYRLRALWGLWVVCVTGGRHRPGLSLAKRFASTAAKAVDPVASLIGERLVGTSLHFLGEQENGKRRVERMIDKSDASNSRTQITRFQFDQSSAANAYLARILWLQGCPDQARRAAERSVAQAQALNHSLSLCYSLGSAACPIALLAGDLTAAERSVSMLIELSARNVLALWHIMGRCFRGILDIKRGDHDVGLPLLGAALGALHESGFTLYHTAALAEFAEGRAAAGQIAGGHAAIDAALAQSQRNEERWCLPELLRIKGRLLALEDNPSSRAAAEVYFLESLDWARKQGAWSWELRAATDLARLRQGTNAPDEARHILAPSYARFTEGFETADLKAAKQVLSELA